MANYPTSLPSSTPATHVIVNDEVVAIADEVGLRSARKIGVIARQFYNPALTTISTTSATFVDIDATNFALTFVAPQSGNVLIVAVLNLDNAVGNQTVSANLREATADIANTDREICFGGARNFGVQTPIWTITGLTAGTSYTYKVGFARTVGTTSAVVARVGGGTGPFTMYALGVGA